jgi:hypothetical protein
MHEFQTERRRKSRVRRVEEPPPEVKNGLSLQTWAEACQSHREHTSSSRAPSHWKLLHASLAIINCHPHNPGSCKTMLHPTPQNWNHVRAKEIDRFKARLK